MNELTLKRAKEKAIKAIDNAMYVFNKETGLHITEIKRRIHFISIQGTRKIDKIEELILDINDSTDKILHSYEI